MNTKTTAVIIIFTALTIALNLSPIKFPAPYAPFLIYQIWEIPIVAAFLLYGTRVGIPIAILNTLMLLAVFPGLLPTGPFYNLAAVLSMLLGIGIIKSLAKKHSPKNQLLLGGLFTVSGIILRVAAMAIVNYVFLRFPSPVGYGLNEETIIAYVPLVVIFNVTLALYTIPIGHFLAELVKSSIKGFK